MYCNSGSVDNQRSATRIGEDFDSSDSTRSEMCTHGGDEANATNDTLSDFEVSSDSGKSVTMSGYSDCGYSLEDEDGGRGEVGSDQVEVGQGQVSHNYFYRSLSSLFSFSLVSMGGDG
ncbi:hypothetical protein K435DRAFT_880611 [Dendrothele bispora CBS 962.96]|uniref:Uncharacterized protein n=1 Tax=Dendrothele bispora (strain CBS 962.96) TaxID=1314807 RepID=A0A4V4HAG9_DENBC|nr:hypothetical protein K435DRAFT_880611 [Dendrothele bispora CBS 962.96]